VVTAPLQKALETLRDVKRTRTLWVDQLCINQEDVQERDSQVKNMHHVHYYATRTVVFLRSVERETVKQYYHAWQSRSLKAMSSRSMNVSFLIHGFEGSG
jgi:hypothetical protein